MKKILTHFIMSVQILRHARTHPPTHPPTHSMNIYPVHSIASRIMFEEMQTV